MHDACADYLSLALPYTYLGTDSVVIGYQVSWIRGCH